MVQRLFQVQLVFLEIVLKAQQPASPQVPSPHNSRLMKGSS
jgi:hypothetical protein